MITQTSAKPLPFFFIGQQQTQERIGNYLSQKHGLLTTSLGKPDTKSIWYSREHVEKLLEEIDYNSGDGLRIYFGAYEEGHEFEGQLCLVMYVTRQEGSGELATHPNIVLENMPDYESRSAQERDVIFFPGESIFTSRKKDFNYGSPCPPRCEGGDQ
jgi:hypothetical protein